MNQSTAITFVGGIHGTGKSTLCQELAPIVGAIHVTASELIRLAPVERYSKSKLVASVWENQRRLAAGLRALKTPSNRVLLDGHFCLLNLNGVAVPIEGEIYQQISPQALLLVDIDPSAARDRLMARDGVNFNLNQLAELSECERNASEKVADNLQVPLIVCSSVESVAIVASRMKALGIW